MAALTGNDNSKTAASRTFARMNAIQVFLWYLESRTIGAVLGEFRPRQIYTGFGFCGYFLGGSGRGFREFQTKLPGSFRTGVFREFQGSFRSFRSFRTKLPGLLRAPKPK